MSSYLRTLCLLWCTILLLSVEVGSSNSPVLYLGLPGSIMHEKTEEKIHHVKNETECGLLCKYDPGCAGMIYTKSNNTCQLIFFLDYKFLESSNPEEQVYICHRPFWNESEYDFAPDCPTPTMRDKFMKRMAARERTRCKNNITLYGQDTLGAQIGFSCTANQDLCTPGCGREQYVVLLSGGVHKELDNRFLYNARCLNGEWFLFSRDEQKLIPVETWGCTENVRCAEGWTLYNGRCWLSVTADPPISRPFAKQQCRKKNASLPIIRIKLDYDHVVSMMLHNEAPLDFFANVTGEYSSEHRYESSAYPVKKYKSSTTLNSGYGHIDRAADLILVSKPQPSYNSYVCEHSKRMIVDVPDDYAEYQDLLARS